MNKGDKVKTWTSDKVGTVVSYNSSTKEVTVKYRNSNAVDVLPVSMCSKV
ncbi:MAG: hypothetical protein H6Q13_1398 [Bacteroidetes bacterium]|jgi:hypothetical protein|nr:hypothetical protein [uncultured Bacteroides sp.]MBP1613950.1 hypothetical protein [Bacteroidota bacterium]